MTTRADAGFMVQLDQLQAFDANGFIANATAAHGVFIGNTEGSGDSFGTLLNQGGDASIKYGDDEFDIKISDTGMFSTANGELIEDLLGSSTPPTVDLIIGDAFNPVSGSWVSNGKTETDTGSQNGPFEMVGDDESDGTLTLVSMLSPLSGDVVIALKGGNYYAVYAFQGLSAVTHFEFDMDAIRVGNGNSSPGLSHASLYSSSELPGNPPPPPSELPEPSSLAVFGLITLGAMTTMALRRRRTLAAA